MRVDVALKRKRSSTIIRYKQISHLVSQIPANACPTEVAITRAAERVDHHDSCVSALTIAHVL